MSTVVLSECSAVAGRRRPSTGDENAGEVVVLKRLRLGLREVTFEEFMEQMYLELSPSSRMEVQEKVHKLLNNYPLSVPRHAVDPIRAVIQYRLYFQNKFPSEIFTFRQLEAEGKKPIKIAIKDVSSDETVKFGPYSSIKLKVVVLEADIDFACEDRNNEEFFARVVSERVGKEPLLKGKLYIEMSNGECTLEAFFTDNSSWTRSGKFRLGAMVCTGRLTGGSVQGAISEAFKVKVRRVAANQKNDTPLLNDEVWRLKHISKNGVYCTKLNQHGILTVQHFLRYLIMFPKTLRNILSSMPEKKWEDARYNALNYIPDEKLYSYHTKEGCFIIFNSIFELVGAEFDGCGSFHLLNDLDPSQKALANNHRQQAYDNLNDIVEFNGTQKHNDYWPLCRMDDTLISLSSPSVVLATASHDEQGALVGVEHQPSPFSEHFNVQFQLNNYFDENQCIAVENLDVSSVLVDEPSSSNIVHLPTMMNGDVPVTDEGCEHLAVSYKEFMINRDGMTDDNAFNNPDDAALSSPRKRTKLSSVMLVIITCIMLRKSYETSLLRRFSDNDDYDFTNGIDSKWLLEVLGKSP